ncbi:hypothetical protein GUJ93_ZPchr0009g1845 [Zizania palustris]|uniref:Uncharacterized protein n=1 Tax=Zizania palustris TaxID=103762 RepID=A0A8J5UYU7_ZIZPA|nr:hypothetical protein GUJ93_ZPchr0009g1845 [Zizania palustris]
MALCAPPLRCGVFGRGGLFTAAELAVAAQLVQLSGSGGEEASSSSSRTSSPRSVNTCTAKEAESAGVVEAEEEVKEFAGLFAGGVELDRRARKRYRLLSELYVATAPFKRGAACRKRKRGPEAEIASLL